MNSWGFWINEPIFTDEGVYTILKRKQAIHLFCYEGLIPFVEAAGYKFYLNDKELFIAMLRLLYKLQQGAKVQPLLVDIPYFEEQYGYFHHKLDTEAWTHFWNKWGSLQDFEKDRYAYCMQYELAEFVWSWIDFDRSPSAQRLHEELEYDEYQEEVAKGKDDPYLQETSKRDYQDRHW